MSTLFTSLGDPMLAWLGDYYFVATLLLLAALVGRRFVRQPAHRILIAWTVMLELVVLAVVLRCRSGRGSLSLPRLPRKRLQWPSRRRRSCRRLSSNPSCSCLQCRCRRGSAEIAEMSSIPCPSNRRSRKSQSFNRRASAPQPRMTWSEWAVAAYLAGAALVGLWLCWGAAATTWLCWRARSRRPIR